MEYTLENDYLKVTVTTWGAQVKSVVRKCDGVEHIWQADPAVWGYHAPILFPHAGKVVDGVIEAKGKTYASGQHGFARGMEHAFVDQTADTIVLELCACPETLERFPYEFRLVSTFTLENDTLHHTLTVENLDEERMPFGIGYHPAFAVPFDDQHQATDYELRFSQPESPLCVNNLPLGLMHGDCYYLGSNIQTLAIDDKLFANDSHCMVNLQSQTLGLYEKGTPDLEQAGNAEIRVHRALAQSAQPGKRQPEVGGKARRRHSGAGGGLELHPEHVFRPVRRDFHGNLAADRRGKSADSGHYGGHRLAVPEAASQEHQSHLWIPHRHVHEEPGHLGLCPPDLC